MYLLVTFACHHQNNKKILKGNLPYTIVRSLNFSCMAVVLNFSKNRSQIFSNPNNIHSFWSYTIVSEQRFENYVAMCASSAFNAIYVIIKRKVRKPFESFERWS